MAICVSNFTHRLAHYIRHIFYHRPIPPSPFSILIVVFVVLFDDDDAHYLEKIHLTLSTKVRSLFYFYSITFVKNKALRIECALFVKIMRAEFDFKTL